MTWCTIMTISTGQRRIQPYGVYHGTHWSNFWKRNSPLYTAVLKPLNLPQFAVNMSRLQAIFGNFRQIPMIICRAFVGIASSITIPSALSLIVNAFPGLQPSWLCWWL
ncbi:hypothetical protein M405DRAFT_77236 [Rhizopogon salebrosus TDB-379]|nr:hypothetical protein M405DRAFT_77236 [Rhizopogon salebrosus TDB-379]